MNIKGILRVSFVAPVCVYCVTANQEAVGEFTGVEEVIFDTKVQNEVLRSVREATLRKLPGKPEYEASVNYIEKLLKQHLLENNKSNVDSSNYSIQKELDGYAQKNEQWDLDSFTGANWNYILLCQIIMDVQKYKFDRFDAVFTTAIENLTTRNKEYAKYKEELELASLDLRVYLSEGYHAIMDMAFYIQNCGVRMMSNVDKFYIDDNRLDPKNESKFNDNKDNTNDERYQDVQRRILRQLRQKLTEAYPWKRVWDKLTGKAFKDELEKKFGVSSEEIETKLTQQKEKAEEAIKTLRLFCMKNSLKTIAKGYDNSISENIKLISAEFNEEIKRETNRIKATHKKIEILYNAMKERLFEDAVENLYKEANTELYKNNYTVQRKIRIKMEEYEELIEQIDKIAKKDNEATTKWADKMYKRFKTTLNTLRNGEAIMSKYVQEEEKNEIIAYFEPYIRDKIQAWVYKIQNAHNKTNEYKKILEDMQLCIEQVKSQCCQFINITNINAVNRAIKVKHNIEEQYSLDSKIKKSTVEAILGEDNIPVIDQYTKGKIDAEIKQEYQNNKIAMNNRINNNINQMWNTPMWNTPMWNTPMWNNPMGNTPMWNNPMWNNMQQNKY